MRVVYRNFYPAGGHFINAISGEGQKYVLAFRSYRSERKPTGGYCVSTNFVPCTENVDPVNVSTFLRDWEHYVPKVSEKKEVPTLIVASFKVSVDPGLLRRMHYLKKSKHIAPGKTIAQLSSTHIEKRVYSLVEREESTFDPAVIEKASYRLKMPMEIADPEERIMKYCNEIFSRLESIGYDNFKDVNRRKTIKLLQEGIYSVQFKAVIQKTLEYHEPIQKDVEEYVHLLGEEAKANEKYKNVEKNRRKTFGSNRRNAEDASRRKISENIGKKADPDRKRKHRRPLYLNKKCAEKGV